MAILIYLIIHYSNTYFSFFFFFQFLIRKVRNWEKFLFLQLLHFACKHFHLSSRHTKTKFSTNFRLRKFETLRISIFRSHPSSHPLILKLDRECVDLRVPIRCSHQWPRWIRVQKRGGEPHGCQWNAHKSCR